MLEEGYGGGRRVSGGQISGGQISGGHVSGDRKRLFALDQLPDLIADF
jgi:hypothetical protein